MTDAYYLEFEDRHYLVCAMDDVTLFSSRFRWLTRLVCFLLRRKAVDKGIV